MLKIHSSGYKRSALSADFINYFTSVLQYLPKAIITVLASKLYKYASYEDKPGERNVSYRSKLYEAPEDPADQSPCPRWALPSLYDSSLFRSALLRSTEKDAAGNANAG